MATPLLALPPAAQAGVSIGIGVSVGIPPPALPVYVQPMAPGPGYIWTPGYWAWDPGYGDYYWVPGTWVMPPQIGFLWTPGWWGWSDGFYRWHGGYWGSQVGFYGGINYGHGYFGDGYSGGYWRGRDFYYNRAVNNINITHIHNTYINRTVINHGHGSRVSYNGGRGGLSARPDARQRDWANQRHLQPTPMQARQRDTAMRDPAQRFKSNRGRPAVFATQHAGNFQGAHTVRAPGAAANRHMVATPQRSRPTTAAPNRRMMEAPHNRAQQPRAANQAFRQERAAQPNQRGFVQAPRERPQQARQPHQSFRQERVTGPTSRGPVQAPREQSRQAPQPNRSFRQERAAPSRDAYRQPPARGGEHGKGHPDNKQHDNKGPGH
jgi:hypothetical protein